MGRMLLASIMLLSGAALFGQSNTTLPEIAVFRLSHSGTDVPPRAISEVDRQVRDAFVNLGRFDVVGMDFRLTEDETAQLMEKLKEYKVSSAHQTTGFSVGEVSFDGPAATRLAESSIIVVPVLTAYVPQRDSSGSHIAELRISFTLIDGSNENAIAHFTIRTIGVGSTPPSAARDAAGSIAPQLVYEIRSLPQLDLGHGIVQVNGSTVLIEFGRASGVRVGDEFALVTTRTLPSGRRRSEHTGLLIVNQVKDESSYARVIYSLYPPSVGDRLVKLARIGIESSLFFHVVAASEPLGSASAPVYTVGTLHAVTRGLYNLRPVLGFEVPFGATPVGRSDSYSGPGLPVNLYLGAELNWRLWRFDVVPLAALGIGGVLPVSTTARVSVTLGGGLVQISGTYLMTPGLKAFIDVGMEQWFPLGVSGLLGWGGFYGGVGLSYSY